MTQLKFITVAERLKDIQQSACVDNKQKQTIEWTHKNSPMILSFRTTLCTPDNHINTPIDHVTEYRAIYVYLARAY